MAAVAVWVLRGGGGACGGGGAWVRGLGSTTRCRRGVWAKWTRPAPARVLSRPPSRRLAGESLKCARQDRGGRTLMQGPRSPPSCLVTPALQTISGMVSCRGHSSPRQSEVRRPPRTTYGSLAGCVPSPTCPFKHKHHLTLPPSRFKCTDLPCPPLALSGRLRALSHMPLPSTNTPRSNHPQGLSAQASPAHLWLLGRLRVLVHVPLIHHLLVPAGCRAAARPGRQGASLTHATPSHRARSAPDAPSPPCHHKAAR